MNFYKTILNDLILCSCFSPNNPEGHNSLWVGNVQPEVTEKKLANMFAQ